MSDAQAPPTRGGAVVTGAGRGLGKEIARMLVGLGYAVHLTDVDAGLVDEALADVGQGCTGSPLDVRDGEACRRVAEETAARAGSLTLWVNNAGVLFAGPGWALTEAQRRLTLEVNALGTMNGTVAALEVMRPAGRGHVVNVVSLAGLIAIPGETVYSASKHAALGYSLATLSDLRRAGHRHVHVSAVCPDGIWTPMIADKLDDPQAAVSFTGRLLSTAEVVEAVAHVVRRPRPVTAVPRWRGPQVRLFDLFPGVAVKAWPLVLKQGERTQRRLARRLARGETLP